MYVLYSIAWSGAFFADFDGRCAPCVPGVYRSPELQKRVCHHTEEAESSKLVRLHMVTPTHHLSSFLSFTLQSDDE